MPDLTDDEQKTILGEVLADQLKSIQESLADVPKRNEFKELEDKVEEIQSDMKTVKAVLKDMSKHEKSQDNQLEAQEARITVLETA